MQEYRSVGYNYQGSDYKYQSHICKAGCIKDLCMENFEKRGPSSISFSRRSHNLIFGDSAARLVFCTWLLREYRRTVDFLKHILWTDEATFTRTGITNHRNAHIWAVENPHVLWPTTFQHQFSINVWAGMIDDLVIGPYVLPNQLNQDTFLEFLLEILPVLLEDVPLATRQVMWFQLDGAPAHFALSVRQFLNTHYPQWIGRGGSIAWPPRSPDCL